MSLHRKDGSSSSTSTVAPIPAPDLETIAPLATVAPTIATAADGFTNAEGLTEQAVKDLQNRNGLPSTGIIGDKEAYYLGQNYITSGAGLTTQPENTNPATNGEYMKNPELDKRPHPYDIAVDPTKFYGGAEDQLNTDTTGYTVNSDGTVTENATGKTISHSQYEAIKASKGTAAKTGASTTSSANNQTTQNDNQTTAMAPALTLTGTLRVGSQGAEVSQLQTLLGGLTADGRFGSKTQAAVKAFQAANGLVTDGIVGPKTLAALNASKMGPSSTSTVNAGINSKKTAGAGENAQVTGNPEIDSLIGILNNQSPQKSFTDVYKEIYDSLGLSTMKSDYESQTKAFSDLQDKKNTEAQKINNNPWLTEGVRQQKLKQLDAKYEGKETILTNKLKLLETNITNGRSDAQFVAGQIMDQLQQSHKLTEDIVMKAIDIAEKQSEAENKLTEVSPGATLYNQSTGKAVFTAPKTTTTTPTSIKNEYIKFGSTQLEQARGSDGFVDPYVYKQAYDGWVNGFTDSEGTVHPAVGTASEFTTKFPPAKYVNPKATTIKGLLPTFLQNNPKSARTT